MDDIDIINSKIKEIRQEFIDLYGENSSEIKNGYTYTKINSYLNAFNKFVSNLAECLATLGWQAEDYAHEIVLLLEFARNTEYNIVNYATKSIKKRCNEKRFTTLFKELNTISAKNLGYTKVGPCIADSFGIWLAGQDMLLHPSQHRIMRSFQYDQFN